MSEHIPAWKRISIKKSNTSDNKSTLEEDDDPLNVTTHLATGSLTRKEKKRILRGDDITGNKKSKKQKVINEDGKVEKKIKKEKVSREERMQKKNKVLKDQLRYLIEFYQEKCDKSLPSELLDIENVKLNIQENKNNTKDESNQVVDVWKFSKQKQNWLIKHFLVEDEIPKEFNDLLILYFKDLKGGAKKILLDECQDLIKKWNAYMDEQAEKINSIVNNATKTNDKEEEEQEDKSEKTDEKKEELPMPNKNMVYRCKLIIDKWAADDDENQISTVELKNFKEDDSS